MILEMFMLCACSLTEPDSKGATFEGTFVFHAKGVPHKTKTIVVTGHAGSFVLQCRGVDPTDPIISTAKRGQRIVVKGTTISIKKGRIQLFDCTFRGVK